MSTEDKPVKAYSLGSPFGKVPCEFLQRGHSTQPNEPHQGDPIAVWGQLRGAGTLLSNSTHFYRMDHAYVGRLDFYRMTRGDFQPSKMKERPADRWESLKKHYKLEVKDWRKGSNVVVALSDQRTYDFFNLGKWGDEIKGKIKEHTGREVVLRPREDKRPLGDLLKDAWCLVTYASNTTIDALLAGVPVFTLGPSIARPMGLNDLSKLEAPFYPENREEFFRHMAYCQFANHEFGNGFARRTADETAAVS
jgi:hypothetical protein